MRPTPPKRLGRSSRRSRGRATAPAGSRSWSGRRSGSAGESAPEETFWAIRTLLEQLAADRPLVFSIDDLQWAEPKFLELVEHVADFARDAPILLACMARPEFLDDHPSWAGGKLNATSILVEALGPEECGTLVANLLADDGVDAAVRARIAEAAEGHPLYAEEITGLLVDEGRLVLKEGGWVATSDLHGRPGPSDDLGVAGRPVGPVARRRTAAPGPRLRDGPDLLPRGGALARGRPRTSEPSSARSSAGSSSGRNDPTWPRPTRWRSVTC